MTEFKNNYEKSNDKKILFIDKIIRSSMADDDTKGDIVFGCILDSEKDGFKEITLDFTEIELVNTAFLNNAIWNLFDTNKFDINKCKILVKGMDETMMDLLQETIRVARQKFVKL